MNAAAGTPESAIIIQHDRVKKLVTIEALVKKGFSSSPVPGQIHVQGEVRANDKCRFVATCNSGAQILSTDFYTPGTFFQSGYTVSFERGTYFRPMPELR